METFFGFVLSEFGRYAGRMKFESSNPTQNSALLILSTEESDEGTYTCRISTFPNGNFERQIALTVWGKSLFPIRAVGVMLKLRRRAEQGDSEGLPRPACEKHKDCTF